VANTLQIRGEHAAWARMGKHVANTLQIHVHVANTCCGPEGENRWQTRCKHMYTWQTGCEHTANTCTRGEHAANTWQTHVHMANTCFEPGMVVVSLLAYTYIYMKCNLYWTTILT